MFDDLVTVAEWDNSEMYDWWTTVVWYSPSRRRYFWLQDAGCSCSYFGDMVDTIDDLENGDRVDALRAFKDVAGADHPDYAKLALYTHEQGRRDLKTKFEEDARYADR